ncbi:hypothetical protein DPMN_132327 [Dreissena polymorpha]|uniref:Uncharacterized protein n=1 Tax=Dreissena polymorpha TaxID=45954 RepID=A0A9D4J9Z9_DREPO|nr:hypothetical protein DPMN_132327 [Dreissena polymorpha]
MKVPSQYHSQNFVEEGIVIKRVHLNQLQADLEALNLTEDLMPNRCFNTQRNITICTKVNHLITKDDHTIPTF